MKKLFEDKEEGELIYQPSQKGMIKIEDVIKMINNHIKIINQLREKMNMTEMIHSTSKTRAKYHVFEVTEFEKLKQSLKELGEK